jgi:hypothetical protein
MPPEASPKPIVMKSDSGSRRKREAQKFPTLKIIFVHETERRSNFDTKKTKVIKDAGNREAKMEQAHVNTLFLMESTGIRTEAGKLTNSGVASVRIQGAQKGERTAGGCIENKGSPNQRMT